MTIEVPEEYALSKLGQAKRQLKQREYIETEILAAALAEQNGNPLPNAIADYLIKLVQGKIKKPRGQQPEPEWLQYEKYTVAAYCYDRILEALQAGLGATEYIREDILARGGEVPPHTQARLKALECADPGEGAPHQRAAEMVARAVWPGLISGSALLNTLSAYKNEPVPAEIYHLVRPFVLYFYQLILKNLQNDRPATEGIFEGVTPEDEAEATHFQNILDAFKRAQCAEGPIEEQAERMVAEAFCKGAHNWKIAHDMIHSPEN